MSNGKIQLKGKSLKALSDYFESPDSYSVSDGCMYDEAFDSALQPVFHLFREYMTTNEVYELAYNAIARAEDGIRSSAELADLNDSQVRCAVIGALENAFSQYPRKYEVRITLPKFGNLIPCELIICDGMRLCINASSGASDSVELVIQFAGYCSANIDNQLVAKCFQRAKVFLFLMEWEGLLLPAFSHDGATATALDVESNNVFAISVPHDLAIAIGGARLRFHKVVVEGDLRSADQLVVRLQERLTAIGGRLSTVFLQGNESIATAIEWYTDSRAVANQTVALLEVCIGMEAILGDVDDIKDMSNRLCDRLAFLLGKSRQERALLSQQYRSLLTIRGKLVHGKHARLQDADAQVLRDGRKLLKRVIEHELAVLTD